MTADESQTPIGLTPLRRCFEGAVPAVIATASAAGTPNVTYLSKVHVVDDERVALSNQFFSKTSRNLAENPRASVLVLDPTNYDHYRLTLVFERTERRGPVFEQLREEVDAVAALSGMEDVFKLRAADVYRVQNVERVLAATDRSGAPPPAAVADRDSAAEAVHLAELSGRLSRCPDLDAVVSATVDGLHDLLGFEHSMLLLLDETAQHLYTIASHGYETQGVGYEVAVGEGTIGTAARRCAPIRVGNVRQMARYSRTVRRSFEDTGGIGPGREVPFPGLADADSRLAVPAVAHGQVVGVLLVESTAPVAFGAADEALLAVVASIVAGAVETDRVRAREPAGGEGRTDATATDLGASAPETRVRFFAVDGSTFLDDEYLIKGVAGRILWSLLGSYAREGRVDYTNREVRLDPTLELPEFRDNFESRLILLKRRLEERGAPIGIEKTGRGRFRLVVTAKLRLERR